MPFNIVLLIVLICWIGIFSYLSGSTGK